MTDLRLQLFLSGTTLALAWVCALFFYQFWKRTHDLFFIFFADAFFLMGCERLVLLFVGGQTEYRVYGYSLRLLAFVIIVGGIVYKNRAQKEHEVGS